MPEYQERVIIESETASLASDLQPLPYDSATEDFVDGEQLPKTDSREEIQSISITSGVLQATKGDGSLLRDLRPLDADDILSSSRKKLSVHVEPLKGHLQGEPMEGVDQTDHIAPVEGFLRKGTLQESSDADMVDATLPQSHGDDGDQIMHNLCDNSKFMNNSLPQDIERQVDVEMDIVSENPKSLNYKRKHNTTPDGVTRQMLKSPKGDMTSDIDNSSDSGISGDLAEDVELHISSPNPSSPLSKETCPESKGLTIEELVSNNLNSEDTENEYFVSLVHKVFGGKLATCIKCLQCKTESIHKDIFTDIHLAFQDSERYSAADAIRKNPSRLVRQENKEHSELSIEDMIKSYLTSERLTGENQYECERCGGKQDAERSIQILEPPEHLILTQLRLYYDTARGQRHKVFTNVEFGEELLLPIRYSTQGSFEDDLTLREQETLMPGESHECDKAELTGEHSSCSDSITSTQEKCVSCRSSEACPACSGDSKENCSYKTYLSEVSQSNTIGSTASIHDNDEASSSSKMYNSENENFGSSDSENWEPEATKNYLQGNNSHVTPDSTSLQTTASNIQQSPLACSNSSSDRSLPTSGASGEVCSTVHERQIKERKCEETLSNRSESLLTDTSCESCVKVTSVCSGQSECKKINRSGDLGAASTSDCSIQPSCSYSVGVNPEVSYSFSHSDSFQGDSSVHDESSSASSTNPQQSSQLDNSCRTIANLPHTSDCPMNSEYSDCLSSKEECEDTQEITYARYALYGVVVHSGFSSEGGHYYCYARNSSVAALPEAAKER